MRVVLLQDVRKIGRIYEIKEVADGYAINYLIPQGLVKKAEQETVEWALNHQKINEEMRKSMQKELDALEDAIERADLAEVLRHKLILEVLLR